MGNVTKAGFREMSGEKTNFLSVWLTTALKTQVEVLYALVLHDIKSRFFGNGLGYIVSILWPLTHVIVVVTIFVVTGRAAPFGDSALLYASTGVIPFIVANYISRFMTLGVVLNKSFLQYPIIKVIDIMTARAILEIMSAFIVVFLLYTGLSLLGVDCVPNDPFGACQALLASIFLGLGWGYLNGAIAMMFPFWVTITVLFTIGVYATSGILFIPDSLPELAQYYLSFNPVLHLVSWMRASYYANFSHHILDKRYAMEFSFVTLALGIMADRFLREFSLRSK